MKVLAENRKAKFNYFLEDKFEAGIVLEGSEVKSLKAGKCTLADAYVSILGGEVWLKNCEIALYEQVASAFKPDTRRARKMLLNSSEIKKLKQKTSVKGYTLVPTKIYVTPKGLIKVEFCLAKGKHSFDKKQAIKMREIEISAKREIK